MAKQNKSEFIDLGAIFREYASKWYLFVISVVVCVALGWVATKIFPTEYAVKANVLISQEDDDPMGGAGALGSLSGLFGSSASVDDEIFVITSHSLYRDVARTLGANKTHIIRLDLLSKELAYPEFPIDVIATPGIIDTLRNPVWFKIKVNDKGLASVKAKVKRETIADVKKQQLPLTLNTIYGHFVIDTTAFYVPGEELNTDVIVMGYDAAAEVLSEDINSSIASKRSNAIQLNMETSNIEFGKDVLNQIIEKYNERGIAEKNLRGEKTAKFIDERLAIISEDLREAETAIQSYKESKGIIDVGAEAGYQTGIRGETERKLTEAETAAELIKMTGEFVSNPENAYSLVPMSGSIPELNGALNNYNSLLLSRMELSSDAKPNNIALQKLDQKIDAVRAGLIASVAKTYENAQVQIRELRSKMNSAMGRLGTVPAQEREFLNMKRQQEVKQELYLFLLQRREETAMMLANATPKGLIVDEAYAMIEPVSMGKKKILAISFVIGVLLAMLVIYLQNVLRTKFSTRDELESLTSAPLLGEISQSRSKEALVVTPKSTSSTVELFRLMRSNLLFVLGDPSNKVILVTSTKSGEGKSFISINLASSLAILGKKVLLIGLDIRKPRLAEYLNMSPTPGFTTYIAGGSQMSLDSIIHKNALIEGMDIIFAGPVPPNPSELLISDKIDAFFKEVREMYDYIIIDSAPVGMVSDTLSLARVADATVYVTRANYTTKSDIRLFTGLYEDKRLPNPGIVLNGTKSKQGYGYGYGEKS